MRSDELTKILRTGQFRPLILGLSDGRRVIVRHPDQVIISARHVYIGLAAISLGSIPATPDARAAMPVDFIWVDPGHVVSVEPYESNGQNGKAAAD